MSRSVKEWVGKTDDEPVPPRVRVRNFLANGGVCCECGVKITGKRWVCDHRKSLKNGGENRESNLGPIHEACNKIKTAADVAEKSMVYRKTAKNIGVRLTSRPKMRGAGFRKSPPQRSATRPLARRVET